MTNANKYTLKAFKNNKWYNYSEPYNSLKEALQWLTDYRLKVGYSLQTDKQLRMFKTIQND
jgi:hypothetical protein